MSVRPSDPQALAETLERLRGMDAEWFTEAGESGRRLNESHMSESRAQHTLAAVIFAHATR